MDDLLSLARDIANLKGQQSRTARRFRAFFFIFTFVVLIASIMARAAWLLSRQ